MNQNQPARTPLITKQARLVRVSCPWDGWGVLEPHQFLFHLRTDYYWHWYLWIGRDRPVSAVALKWFWRV